MESATEQGSTMDVIVFTTSCQSSINYCRLPSKGTMDIKGTCNNPRSLVGNIQILMDFGKHFE